MSHTPFGYRIEHGKAVIDKENSEKIMALYNYYLSGDSMDTAAKKAGIKLLHSGIGRILQNTTYLGNEYYPAIIDPDTFAAVKAERVKRAGKLGRIREPKEEPEAIYPTSFYIKESTQQYEDPFQQAEYAYSLIEIEVNDSGSQ